MGSVPTQKPHVVLVPYPAQGHITPMLKLAKLLHTLHNFHVTFVNTEFNHNRHVNSHGSLNGLPDFNFETIPDGLPPSDENLTQDIPALCDSTTKNCLQPFKNLLAKLNDDDSVPNVDCIVTDGVMTFSLDAAKDLGIPGVLLWTASACGLLSYRNYHELIARGLVPLKDMSDVTNGYLDAPVEWISGLKNMRLKDIPSFIRTADPNDIMLNFFVREAGRASLATAIITNTYDELERSALDALTETLPAPIFTIGPLCLLERFNVPTNSPITSIGSSLWKEETDCLDWLDGKKPGSVLLVNFGSITTMTSDNLVEFAWGLANSKAEFMWVIRPDLVKGESAILPDEFLREIDGRGILAHWCNQEAVLLHASVGGFLTHCGWNSTTESISGGVPTLCWPFFAEQQTNCRYLGTEWGMGMEIDNDVKRDEVEKIVRELVEGEKGKEMRRRSLEWKEYAVEATRKEGRSYANLERVVKEVLLGNKTW